MAPRFKIQFGWIDKDTLGIADYDKKLIVINWEIMVVSTWLHEDAHRRHPNWNEKRTLAFDKKALQRMTVKEIRAKARQLLRTAKWEDYEV